MVKKYNINELLERKKEIESKVDDTITGLSGDNLIYLKEEITDHTTNKIRTVIPKEKQDLPKFVVEFIGLVNELSKIKTAIQKYNADKVLGKLQLREKHRILNKYLSKIKEVLPREMKTGRKVSRTGKDGETLESIYITNEPFFKVDDVDKMMDESSAEERKINTEIQKENLNANIEL